MHPFDLQAYFQKLGAMAVPMVEKDSVDMQLKLFMIAVSRIEEEIVWFLMKLM